jgi:hypothetical protein
MKYVVKVGDTDIEVVLDGDEVTADGVTSVAHVNDVEGTPVRMVTIGDEVHRVVARRGASRRPLYALARRISFRSRGAG